MLPGSTHQSSLSVGFQKVTVSKNDVFAGDVSRPKVDSSHLTQIDFESSQLFLSEYVKETRTECVSTEKNTVSRYKHLMRPLLS